MRKVIVEEPKDLKEGDIIFVYYSRPRLYMTKVERVFDDGSVIVGQGGHAHRVNEVAAKVITDIPKYQGVGTDVELLRKALEEGSAVEVENGVEYYKRMRSK